MLSCTVIIEPRAFIQRQRSKKVFSIYINLFFHVNGVRSLTISNGNFQRNGFGPFFFIAKTISSDISSTVCLSL